MTTVDFTLTKEEADVAAARVAWRLSLADGLTARHLAPLAAFLLAILFAAILGLSGLVSRRAAETALIVAAAAYMLYRLWTRRRFLSARRQAAAWAQRLSAGPARLTLGETGLRLEAAGVASALGFAEDLNVETVSGLVYVWPRSGPPLVWPERADAKGEFLAFARRGESAKAPPLDDDDDD